MTETDRLEDTRVANKKKREKMTVEERAKQFMPFMAVTGLYEALAEKEKEIEKEYEEEKTPEYKVPAGSMPESGKKPDNKDVEGLMASVSSEGDVHVVAEESSQGHVPSAPEIRNRAAGIGMVEILLEMESHTASHSDSHIRISREIIIYLN